LREGRGTRFVKENYFQTSMQNVFIEKFWGMKSTISFILVLQHFYFYHFLLGLIHTRHFCTQYCDKKTKRYCNKKIKRHFSTNIFFSLCELKIFISVYLTRFWNVTTIFWQKNVFLFFYCNIFLSQYRNIVRKNIVCE